MREYLFRGKQADSNEWAEGCLIHTPNYCCILQDEEKVHPIDYPYLDNDTGCFDGYATPVMPETVGQYTGLTDKNGKKIFEGDILKSAWGYKGAVDFEDILYAKGECLFNEECEIIGNIHDNPELLKGGEQQ